VWKVHRLPGNRRKLGARWKDQGPWIHPFQS
jgi:hypothetical protein